MDNSKPMKATSYKDLIQTFQQAINNPPTNRQKRPPRTLQLKKPHPNNKQNIQSKNHQRSAYEKSSLHHHSQWMEEDVLKQLNQKRKQKQHQFSYNKFISYITTLMASLTGYVPPDLLHKKITYLQYLAALKDIRFIKQTYEPSPTDSVSQLWGELSSNQQTVGVFILFVSGILNMKKNDDQNASQKYHNLWKKYSDLRYTRMQLLGKTKTSQNDQQYSFSPAISTRSRTLAASRSKSKRLLQKNTCKKNSSQILQQSAEARLNNNRQILKDAQHDTAIGNKRSQILYKLAKQKSLQKRIDKKSNEVEYQKSIKELTFKPKIHPNNKQNINKKHIQGEQDSIDRMIRGRIERQVKMIIKQKGLPYNQKLFQKMKNERYEAIKKNNKNPSLFQYNQEMQDKKQKANKNNQETVHEAKQCELKGRFPLVLSVEVDEGVIKKLIINQGEDYKQVADKFIKQLNLSEEMYDKLIVGVENALRSQLTQIDEDSFESEYQSIC